MLVYEAKTGVVLAESFGVNSCRVRQAESSSTNFFISHLVGAVKEAFFRELKRNKRPAARLCRFLQKIFTLTDFPAATLPHT
jgi:hypothetical protein